MTKHVENKTDYPGIDYGLGQSNINLETGIRFGVISQHSLGDNAIGDLGFGSGWNDDSYDASLEEAQKEFARIVDESESTDDMLQDFKRSNLLSDIASGTATCEIFAAKQTGQSAADIWPDYADLVTECWESGPNFSYKNDSEGLELLWSNDGNGDIVVIKSPFYANVQFCSPCFPGAGNLDQPCDSGPMTYALGADWFDEDSPCPYEIHSVVASEITSVSVLDEAGE